MNQRTDLFKELQRRNVFRVAVAYIVSSWLLAQVADLVLDNFGAPEWAMRVLLIALAIGFPIALGISWAFEVTAKGVIPESEVDRTVSITDQSGKRLDRIIIIILAIVIVFMGMERFVFSNHDANQGKTRSEIEAKRSLPASSPVVNRPDPSAPPSPFSVAVLPFAVMSTGPDDTYFADGLTEEIINALSQLPELMVTARTSAFHFKGQNLPVSEIAGQLGVANVVEGSVRRAGDQLRITAQLIRAEDGFHLWSETYDRRTEDTFAVQQDIAEKVATALNVLLDEEQRQRMQQAGLRNVDAFTAYQKAFELLTKAHDAGVDISILRQANQKYEEVTALVPDYSRAYFEHADLFTHILLSQANGELDGKITASDIEMAPAALRQDYDLAVRTARDKSQRAIAEADRALLLGDWRGLKTLEEAALRASGCDVGYWTQLTSPFVGMTQKIESAFARMSICNPLDVRAWVHMAFINIFLDQPQRTLRIAQSELQQVSHHWLIWAEAIALAMRGDFEAARAAIDSRPLPSYEQPYVLSLIAAMQGDAETAADLQFAYLSENGPNDQASLVMEAARGNRAEANRLASMIDARPFGHMALLQSIYLCFCGAPFDLEYTPNFDRLLDESGLTWPPLRPIDFPLKEW
ncbi:MAG TPA: hypothetical protein VKN35_07630 [Xanthomonadales bacterium]|nr:hypothetical protein [Xanthomonadales bacterium]